LNVTDIWYRGLFAALLAMALVPNADAGERKGRLIVEVHIEHKGGTNDRATGEISSGTSIQDVRSMVTLVTDGELEDTNRNDHAGNAARMQKQAEEARKRQPGQAKMEERALQLQKQVEACNSDVSCLRRVTDKYAIETSAWSIQAPPADEKRYLMYRGFVGCQSDFSAKIVGRASGTFPDVQGNVPFAETTNADYHATPTDKAGLCNAPLVLDTKAGTIFATLPTATVMGKRTRTEGGRSVLASKELSEIRLHPEAMSWVQDKLKGAARSGKASTTLNLTSPGPKPIRTGTVDIQMSWRFEEL